MSVVAWMAYMAFEAYHTARKRRMGEPVDEYSSLINLRGRRDLKQKTPLWSVDVAHGLATLREQGKAEFFGQPAAALINLMKLCEGRLLPAPAKAAGSAP